MLAALWGSLLLGADAEPYVKVKVCNDAETQCSEVKAASISPLATDKAAVVALSPNGNQATSANQSTQITSLQLLDDVPTANDTTMSKGSPSMGMLDDVSTATVTENNVSTIRITPSRGQHVNLRNNTGTEIGTSSNPLRQDPTGTTTQPVSQSTAAALSGAWPVKITDGTTSADIITTSTDGKNRLAVQALTPALTTSGNITTTCATPTLACVAGSTVELSLDSTGAVQFQISGAFVGGSFQTDGTIDNVNWVPLFTSISQGGTYALTAVTATGKYRVYRVAGLIKVRVRAAAFTSGTAAITIVGSNPINWTESLMSGQYNSTLPTLADGGFGPVQLDMNGRIVTSAITGFGAAFTFGDVTLAAIATASVRRTAYTEPASVAAFSIKSGNAADTSAGTGARTVTITYLDSTYVQQSETITLNGTTCVNSVTTTARYFESVKVVTGGSTGSNVGLLTFYTGTGCVTTVGTIPATDNQTLWAHHYVQTGKTSNITGLSVNHSGTTVGSGAVFFLKSLPLNIANAVESQVGDFHRLYGQSSTAPRSYVSPIKVNGPARITVYVTPETSSSTVYRASIDFFEP